MGCSKWPTDRQRAAAALLLGAASLIALPQAVADPPVAPPPPAVEGPSGPTAAGPPGDSTSADKASPAPDAPTPAEAVRKRPGRIRGTVTDPLKRPLPGLLVTLSSRREPDILRVTGTNEKGQYVFQELPSGVYDLKVQADGFQDTGKESIEIRPPFQNIVDVRMQPRGQGAPAPAGGAPAPPDGSAPVGDAPAPDPVTVRGRFVDQGKRPLVEVSVVLSSLQGKGIFQAYSGDDGSFEIPGIVPGRYRVIVRSPGHVPLDLRSVEILGRNGLSVSLMLVDYPLNFKAGQEARMPLEEPRTAPAPPSPEGEHPAPAAADADSVPPRADEPAAGPGG